MLWHFDVYQSKIFPKFGVVKVKFSQWKVELARVNREFELVLFELADSKWMENGVKPRRKSYFVQISGVLIYRKNILFREDR